MSHLSRFIPQTGMLKYREREMKGRSSPDSYANHSTSSSVKGQDDNNNNNNNNEDVAKSDHKFILKSLRRGIDLTSSAKSSTSNVVGNTDSYVDDKINCDNGGNNNINHNNKMDHDSNDDNKRGMPQYDPFRNQAYLILNAVCHNTLSYSDFPTLNEAMCENDTMARNAAGKRTLRMGLARLHDIAGKRDAGGKSNYNYNNNNYNYDNNNTIKMSSSSTAITNTS